MSSRSTAFALVLLTLATSADARDCADVVRGLASAICQSEDVAQDAARFERLFNATLRALPSDRRALLLASDRTWTIGLPVCGFATGAALTDCARKYLAKRRRDIAVCFPTTATTAADLDGKPVSYADTCPLYEHFGCPRVEAIGSPQVASYRFLVARATAAARRRLVDPHCRPPPAVARADLIDWAIQLEVLAERPGVVFVHETSGGDDVTKSGPSRAERVGAYDTRTGATIPLGAVLPDAVNGSAFARMLTAKVDGHLSRCCCAGGTATSTFAALHIAEKNGEAPAPAGWSANGTGDLLLAYAYDDGWHAFVASAVIPHDAFIAEVAPDYASLFGGGRTLGK